MSGPWNDFNSAQSNTNVIPKGTLAKVRLTLRPGGFDDPSQGWTGGWARRAATGAVYLDAEYTVLEGPYARRKVWSLIGLYSPKGPDWANMGRGLIRGILNSARGVSDKDNSPEAQARRRINGFGDLDGVEFVARIDIGTDTNGEDKNEIRAAVTPMCLAGSRTTVTAVGERVVKGSEPITATPTSGGVRPRSVRTWIAPTPIRLLPATTASGGSGSANSSSIAARPPSTRKVAKRSSSSRSSSGCAVLRAARQPAARSAAVSMCSGPPM